MIQHITKPFKYFFKLEAASGLILLFAAILALIISNGSLSDFGNWKIVSIEVNNTNDTAYYKTI